MAGIAPERHRGGRHPVAHAKWERGSARPSLADLDHVAGHREARSEREGRFDLVGTGDDEPVDEAHSGRPHDDHDLARTGVGIGALLDRQPAHRPELLTYHPPHDTLRSRFEARKGTGPPAPGRKRHRQPIS